MTSLGVSFATMNEVMSAYLAIVTILAEKTRRSDIILTSRSTLRAIKMGPQGREGKNGLRLSVDIL